MAYPAASSRTATATTTHPAHDSWARTAPHPVALPENCQQTAKTPDGHAPATPAVRCNPHSVACLARSPARSHGAALPTTSHGNRTPGAQAADMPAFRRSSGRLLFQTRLLDQRIKQIAPQPPVGLGLAITPLQLHHTLPIGIASGRMAQVVMKDTNTRCRANRQPVLTAPSHDLLMTERRDWCQTLALAGPLQAIIQRFLEIPLDHVGHAQRITIEHHQRELTTRRERLRQRSQGRTRIAQPLQHRMASNQRPGAWGAIRQRLQRRLNEADRGTLESLPGLFKHFTGRLQQRDRMAPPGKPGRKLAQATAHIKQWLPLQIEHLRQQLIQQHQAQRTAWPAIKAAGEFLGQTIEVAVTNR